MFLDEISVKSWFLKTKAGISVCLKSQKLISLKAVLYRKVRTPLLEVRLKELMDLLAHKSKKVYTAEKLSLEKKSFSLGSSICRGGQPPPALLPSDSNQRLQSLVRSGKTSDRKNRGKRLYSPLFSKKEYKNKVYAKMKSDIFI